MLIPHGLHNFVSCRGTGGLRLVMATIMRDEHVSTTAGTVIGILDKDVMSWQWRLYAMIGIGIFQATCEDCFSLNVVAPAQMTEEPLPLMLFIDGLVGSARVARSRVDVQHQWHRRRLRRDHRHRLKSDDFTISVAC